MSPSRLERWLARWADGVQAPISTRYDPDTVTFLAADGSGAVCTPPFPPLGASGIHDGFVPGPLLDHATRQRRVGVLLVRRGGHAAGVFDGDALVDSKVGSRYVQGRTKKGGSSQGRYQRRRANQARDAFRDAADTAARILLPHADELDAVVLGGDRAALKTLAGDPRLRDLLARAGPRILAVADPRLAVLEATPEQFRATLIRTSRPSPARSA